MSNRIKPPTVGITPEAAEALALQGITPPSDDIDLAEDSSTQLLIEGTVISDGTLPELFVGEAEFVPSGEPDESGDAGETIDAAIAVEPKVTKTDDDEPLNKGFGRRRRKNASEPKSTPPNVDEWMDFFSRIVIRFLTEWYVDMLFRDIDDDKVSDTDAAKLLLTEEERDTIARPFAEYANKNPFMRKHGRQIVAFADSFESMVMLGRWYMRVNRLARKYRPKKQDVPARVHINGSNNGHNGQSAPSAASGTYPEGFPIFNPGGS